jgi:hypothetical protein
MFIIKSKISTGDISAQHWSMVESKARPDGSAIITMGLFKDAATANDISKCLRNLETVDVAINLDPTIWSTPQAQPVALKIYQAMVALPAEGEIGGYFSGCTIGQ